MKINGELEEVVLQELLYLHLAVVQISYGTLSTI